MTARSRASSAARTWSKAWLSNVSFSGLLSCALTNGKALFTSFLAAEIISRAYAFGSSSSPRRIRIIASRTIRSSPATIANHHQLSLSHVPSGSRDGAGGAGGAFGDAKSGGKFAASSGGSGGGGVVRLGSLGFTITISSFPVSFPSASNSGCTRIVNAGLSSLCVKFEPASGNARI